MPEEDESYWVQREKDNISREQMKDEDIVKQLEEIIGAALREADKEIHAFYSRYANKCKLTPKEAKKRISEFDVKDFEATAARYVKEKNFSDKANKELYTYNTKMKINRQELLMLHLNAHLTAMADEQMKMFHEYLERVGVDEVARQAGILGKSLNVTRGAITAIVGASFHGATWSSRIWGDMSALRSQLEKIINSSIIRGVHPNQFVKDIREQFDVTTFEAKRLLITEAARVQIESQMLSYETLAEEEGFEAEYQFVAKLDEKTSKTCRSLDGEKFKVSDKVIGVNAPPMHPFCRSSTRMVLGDWRKEIFEKKKDTSSSLDSEKEKLKVNSNHEKIEEIRKVKLKQSHSNWISEELLTELESTGVKYNSDELIAITKTSSGKLVWLEKGNSKAGFEHVMRHANEFATKGVKSSEIPDLIMEALSKGKLVGKQGRGNGRPIYEVVFNGQTHRVAVTVGNNGFIVGANPRSLE